MFSSRQIRPPIYSLKQSKLRKRRVIRYAMLYFLLLVVFVALIAAPIIIAPMLLKIKINLPMHLQQPHGLVNNDTTSSHTGAALVAGQGATVTALTF